MSTYVLDNASGHAAQRFTSLEACFDPVSIRQLEGVGVARGWSCLEVGGGGGSIARWLAERVGRAGEVLVTDIDPQRLDAPGPNIEMLRHDIVSDPLPGETFDLVHARLVLLHLPERRRALRRMIDSLRPGGWLVVEDFDVTWLPFMPSCGPDEAQLFGKVLDAFHRVLGDRGVDIAHGRFYFPLLVDYDPLVSARGRRAGAHDEARFEWDESGAKVSSYNCP